jgi:hypothetical protein
MEEEKVYYFKVNGKLEAENEAEATDLIHELLGERTQFQIEEIEENN